MGCSHGHLANTSVLNQILKFKDRWKPDTTLHLGDFLDLAALRSGAKGSNDEAASVSEDFDSGITFIKQLRPQYIFIGNHEDRLYRLLNSQNAVAAHCAQTVLNAIGDTAEDLKAKIIPYGISNPAARVKIGDTNFLHGYMYGENATRDHAETFGKCVHAHTHRPGVATGRQIEQPKGYCVGTLADIPAMEYAKARRQTLAWNHGLVIGEYNEKECHLWLLEANNGVLRFPL